LSASLALSLFYFHCFRAGFAKRFNQALNVNAFPECLLTDCMLLDVVGAAQWNYTPVIWLLPHPRIATIANVSAFDWHILTAIDAAMKSPNKVKVSY
jgi:hypothetical protein